MSIFAFEIHSCGTMRSTGRHQRAVPEREGGFVAVAVATKLLEPSTI